MNSKQGDIPQIRILSESVANQIAAGEVVERPAAVVKELLENSIDANATRIEIEFKHGGKSFIKISDNGCGMNHNQALLSLEPHATSKIRTHEDLSRVLTFGFRGEAIPSIASVSNFTLKTRPQGQSLGTQICVSGGKISDVRDCGMAFGTEIVVENLFSTVPARRKFLKSDNVEASHIIRLCRLYALSLPHISISLVENSKVLFSSEKNPDIIGRVDKIFGREIAEKIIPLKKCKEDSVALEGAVLKAGEFCSSNKFVCVFVNSRPVDLRAANYALREAYGASIPRGKYAAAFLFITMNPADVDVNVHPAKLEVRLKDEFKIRDFLISAIENSIGKISCDTQGTFKSPEVSQSWDVSQLRYSPSQGFSENTDSTAPLMQVSFDLGIKSDAPQEAHGIKISWKFLSFYKSKYILFDAEGKLMLLSILGALRRINYEIIVENFASKPALSQALLLPETLHLDSAQSEFLEAHIEKFSTCGFQIDLFGRNTFRVSASPKWLGDSSTSVFIKDFLESALDAGLSLSSAKLSAETFAKMAMKCSFGARIPETEESALALLTELLRCSMPMLSTDNTPTCKELKVD